jgi:hypothetical protein
LSDYVELDKKDDGYEDFYVVFDYFLEEPWGPDYDSYATECCKMLFSAYDRAVASRRSPRASRVQELSRAVDEREPHVQEARRAVDEFEEVGEDGKVLGSENSVTPRIPPPPRDQEKPRRQLSIDARDYILEEITPQAGYFTETRTLREILNQPLSAADFVRKVLDIGESKGNDQNLRGILERIVDRFNECWAEPKAAEPKRLSNFLMEKR